MKFSNVLLASDFDGTLKNDDGKIAEDVQDAISYFMKNGGRFTVCTGRVYQGFHLYDSKYINAPVLLGNGAMAYDYEKEHIVFNDAIGREGCAVIEDILKHFPKLAVELYNFNEVSAINLSETSVQHFTSQGIHFKSVNSPRDAELPWTKVMTAAAGYSQEVQKLLEKHREINFLRTTGDYIEILRKGTDKGTGLLKLAEHLGIDKKDTYSAGDGYNDVDMLKAAHAGFVPENGSREALDSATYITRSNNNGCIAHAIEILDSLY